MDEVLYERKGAGAWRCLNRPEEASPRESGPTPPCGAGRVVCLIDPVGDVYACPFAILDRFLAGNVLSGRGFDNVWNTHRFSESCASRSWREDAPAAGTTTAAAAAAWRRSSSLACPSTAPIPNASAATRRRRWAASAMFRGPAATTPAAGRSR
jgi:hypothetical protein